MLNPVARAIFKRDLKRWFGNPTGYVFITLFVVLATAALFWPNEFFQKNLANLDALNDWFPLLLLFFIPAVTMNVWAGERGAGTDELMLTLPASDTQIVLGKYLAAAGIYTMTLLFTLPLLVFLAYLGDPDWGLMASNYLGFWLLGLALVAAGMVGSQLSDNLTVAFILGAILCGLIVMIEPFVQAIVPPGLARVVEGFGPVSQFHELGRGVVSIASILMFIGLIVAFLYLNLLLLSRRMWRRGERQGMHLSVRFACLLFCAVAATGLGANTGKRTDFTSEQVHSLSAETEQLIRDLPEERVVQITAYVSPDVPADLVRTRRTLLDLLRQYDAMGGDRVSVRVVETKRYSDEAHEAETNFGITHQTRMFEEQGRATTDDVYMGVAFTCGLEEVVIPFLDKGLPVEYELTRSLRVVASADRKTIGILDNDVKIFGDLNYQTFQQTPEWEVVRELKLQYEVERVAPDSDYPENLDVLVAFMPSSLTQPEMDRLKKYAEDGHPTLLVDDPFPFFDPRLAPGEEKGGPQNPMMQQQPPPEEPKGDVRALLQSFDIDWIYGAGASLGGMFARGPSRPAPVIAWQSYSPHPQYNWEPELVFVSNGAAKDAFNPNESITAGLQEVVMIFGGAAREAGNPNLTFTPLLKTSRLSGTLPLAEVIQVQLFGPGVNPRRQHRPDATEHILACRVRGKTKDDAPRAIDLVFLADADLISNEFFNIRRRGIEQLQLDNVTFFLNCVDDLAGDDSFIDLRKRRPIHRTLTRIEGQEEEFDRKWLSAKDDAEAKAASDLADAQGRLDRRVAEIEQQSGLDDQSKAIQIESVREVEQRRLDVRKSAIEDEKSRALDLAQSGKLREEDEIRDFYRIGSVVIVPIPAILFGILTLLRRTRREKDTSRVIETSGVAS